MKEFTTHLVPGTTALLLAAVRVTAWSGGFLNGRRHRSKGAVGRNGKFEDAAVAMGLVGRAQGTLERPPLGGTMGFLLLVALVVFVIPDLSDPTKGLITVNQGPMRMVLESMG
jgi:hypothetical protein